MHRMPLRVIMRSITQGSSAVYREVLLTVRTSNLVRWGAAGFVLSGVIWPIAGFIAAFTNPMLSFGLVFYYVVLVIVARLLLSLGFVLYGVASLQARVLPGWYSILLIIFVPVSAVLGFVELGYIGDIVLGVLLLVLGFVLWQQGEALAEPQQPPRRVV